ncbi:MAG: carotenoid biosynthesis protein, partial [Halanaeroarchaeum sp.]
SSFALGVSFYDAYPVRQRLAFLVAAIPYGVALEQLVILRFARYHYPVDSYLLTIADVPLVIGFGWAAIVYAGFRAARLYDFADWRVPFFVGLFALHVDLAIDAVAIRAGFWTWTPPGVWFGVPLGNFLGWFLVASLFPAAWLGLAKKRGGLATRAAASVGVALAGLIAILQIWTWVATTLVRRILFFGGVVSLALGVVATADPRPRELPLLVSAVPFVFHAYYLGLLVGLGIGFQVPALIPISFAMAGLSVYLHRPIFHTDTATR